VSGRHAINLTAAWTPPAAPGPPAVWRRQFGMPTGIAAADRVWLVVESPAGCTLELNGVAMRSAAAGECLRQDVTRLLRRRNELCLTGGDEGVPADQPGAPLGRRPLPARLGRVWLEIEPTA